MNYVFISSQNVDVARMLARAAGGFFCLYFSYVVRKVRAELQRRECWSKVETEKDTALSPHPSLIVFFFVLGSAFARLYLLLYETQNSKENTQQKNPPSVSQAMHMFGRVQWRWEKGSNGFSISKARKMLGPCLNKVYRKSNRLDISMRRHQMVSTSTVNNTFKKNMLKQSWICLTEAFFK